MESILIASCLVLLVLHLRGLALYLSSSLLFMFAMYRTLVTVVVIVLAVLLAMDLVIYIHSRLAYRYGAVVGKPLKYHWQPMVL